MKRCPTCKQIFTDQNLSFCTEDGTPLIKVEDRSFDPEATLVSPSPTDSAPTDWKGPVYQQPIPFVPVPPAGSRKVWPWIVGILVVLVVVGGGVAAAFMVPNLMRAVRARSENRAVNANGNRTGDDRNANAEGNSNSSVTSTNRSANSNSNTNVNSNANADSDPTTAPPTDEDHVLSDLTDIENEWTVANINADKKKLQRVLADDYVGTQLDGTIQGKADYIKDITPDPGTKHWEFEHLRLVLKGDRATLNGTVRLEVEGLAEEVVLHFTDKFVWRDARWQAVGSEVSRVK
jgi:type II secretory pathway pseudopilin PulG